MTKDLTDNSALTVTSKQLHYWAEYYKDGIGWQPFEVCPDYVGMIKTDDSSVKAKPTNAAKPLLPRTRTNQGKRSLRRTRLNLRRKAMRYISL